MRKLLLIFFLTFTINILFGCRCNDRPSIKNAWKYSRQIFIGKVVETSSSKVVYGYSGMYLNSFTIEIEEMYKGGFYKKRRQYVINDAGEAIIDNDTIGFYNKRTLFYRGSGSCDFWFEKGKRYLVYAFQSDDFLCASICSRTREISDTAIAEIRELKELKRQEAKTKKADTVIDLGEAKSDELNLTKAQLIKTEKEFEILKYCLISFVGLILLLAMIRLISVRL